MKIITRNKAVAFKSRKRVSGTAGIYVLIDPVSRVPRYVGSTLHAEHRLFGHMASCERRKTPKEKWLAELKAKDTWPELWVVEEFDVGPQQGEKRHEAERRWIEICEELFAGADMNSALTPLGHANSKDSTGKKLRAEVVALRARVTELEREHANDAPSAVQHATNLQRCTMLQCCADSKSATQRNTTLRGVAVLH